MMTPRLGRIVTAVAASFLALAALLILAPARGAAFFGQTMHDPAGLLYVRAVGLRDLALAFYLAGLVRLGNRRALAIVLLATLAIPAGDILLLLSSATATPIHYLLHAASLLLFLLLGLWALRSPDRARSRPDDVRD